MATFGIQPAGWTLPPVTDRRPAAAAGGDFAAWLGRSLAAVEEAQRAADQAALSLAAGEAEDLARVVLAQERATLMLSLTVQTRNRMLEAYQEIMRMPL